MSRSFEKAVVNLLAIDRDAAERKNNAKLEDILRNNLEERTFACPGLLRPDIEGLRGKGGRMVPLFAEILTIEEVLKCSRK